MLTYTLIVLVAGWTEPVGGMNFPGYTTLAQCENAGRVLRSKMKQNAANESEEGTVRFYCIPGPLKAK